MTLRNPPAHDASIDAPHAIDATDSAVPNSPDVADVTDSAMPPIDAADAAHAGPQTRYTELVDPFIGTGGNTTINCFPGAIRPWGMVSASPDTTVSTALTRSRASEDRDHAQATR